MPSLLDQEVLNTGISADISLESSGTASWEDDDPNELRVHKVHGELEQTDKLKGNAGNFSIVNDHYLLIHEKATFTNRHYWVHLGCLAGNPKRRLIIAWKWLMAAAGFALLAAAAYNYSTTVDFPHKSYLFPGALIGSTTLAVICLIIFFYQSRYCHVYYSRTGNVPLVELKPNRPDRDNYHRFREILQSHMHRAYGDMNPNNALAMELREHRRLNESGIISKHQYDHAKSLLFKGHSKPERP